MGRHSVLITAALVAVAGPISIELMHQGIRTTANSPALFSCSSRSTALPKRSSPAEGRRHPSGIRGSSPAGPVHSQG